MTQACFNCEAPAQHRHHVVPRSLGGRRTVPLCEPCHGKVHAREFVDHVRLTTAGLAHKKAKGEYTGGCAPYGWRVGADGVKLEIHPGEQAIMARARTLRESGLSLRAVGARLAAEGLLPRTGGRWHATTVNDLLLAATEPLA